MILEGKVYDKSGIKLFHDDAFERIKKFKKESFDFIFADPPYFLSGGGITCSSGKMVSVKKAEWDKEIDVDEKMKFNNRWIKLCRRVMKKDAVIAISGTMHNIYSIGVCLEKNGFKIINNITWRKTNPAPNISCRALTHSTETVLVAKKIEGKHYFNYELGKTYNKGKQLKDVWNIDVWESSHTKPSEKREGKHPTQKPIFLLERLILLFTREGDNVLDPFNGSGTTGVVCKKHGRNYVGIDNLKEYLEISKRRVKKEEVV